MKIILLDLTRSQSNLLHSLELHSFLPLRPSQRITEPNTLNNSLSTILFCCFVDQSLGKCYNLLLKNVIEYLETAGNWSFFIAVNHNTNIISFWGVVSLSGTLLGKILFISLTWYFYNQIMGLYCDRTSISIWIQQNDPRCKLPGLLVFWAVINLNNNSTINETFKILIILKSKFKYSKVSEYDPCSPPP